MTSSENPTNISKSEVESTEVSRKKVVVVENAEALENEARDVAEARMTAERGELKGLSGIFSRIWRHNLFYEYYRQKEISVARSSIIDSKNLYAGQAIEPEVHEEAMAALVDRFSQEYEETLHAEAGEERVVIGATGEKSAEYQAIKDLLRDYAAGHMAEPEFVESRNRILSGLTGLDRAQLDSEVRHTDNLLEIAKQLKQAVENGQSLDNLDLDFELILGKAKSGVRTEAKYNTVDRVVEKLQSTKVGRLVNETTLASSVAIAYSLTAGLSRSFAQSRAAAWGSFGLTAVVTAGLAGARESKRLADERRQHSREMAKGKKYRPDQAPRREEMEKYRYQTEDVDSLTQNLSELLENAENSEADFNVALSQLCDVEARIGLSDRSNIDLLSYSDVRFLEQERLNLDITRAQAKVKLRALVESGKINLPGGTDFDSYLENLVRVKEGDLSSGQEGIDSKDRAFKKMRSKKVATAALKGLATGLVVGGVFQEVSALLRDNQQGVFEGLAHGSKDLEGEVNVTALERLRIYLSGQAVGSYSDNLVDVSAPGGSLLKLPDDVSLISDDNHAGEFVLMHGDDTVVKHLVFENGQLSPDSISELQDHGIDVAQEIKKVSETIAGRVEAYDYVAQHPEDFQHIHRDLWYDNDTVAPVFDKNELRLDWGGDGHGVDKNGNFIFSIKRMMEDGSYHKDFSVDAKASMQSGHIKMLFSLSQDTQSMVIDVPIDADGNAVIDPNSEIGKLFFKEVDGRAVFIGKYAEVAQSMGLGKDGEEHFRILATHVGEGKEAWDGLVTTDKDVPISVFDMPDINPQTDPPPIIPIFGRRPLEPTQQGIEVIPPYYWGGDGLPRNREIAKQKMSETIRNNPNAKLNPRKEVTAYLDKQTEEHKQKIKELSIQAGAMSPDCELSVCIPVAGNQEGDHIYDSLANFLQQTLDPKKYEIVLFVNMPDKDKNGKPVFGDKTAEEIKRFQADHPEVNVRVMSSTLPRDLVSIGLVRKLLNDTVVLRRQQSGAKEDLIMVSNDADNRGMAREYLENFINKFQTNSNADGLLGQTDWDPDSYVRKPLIHVGTRLFQYVDMMIRKRDKIIRSSSGANFALRSSIYAAVGGYDEKARLAEDRDLCQRMNLARQGASKRVAVAFAGARASRLYTSSRRAEKALEEGLSPIEQWDRGAFGALEDEVRKVKWDESGGNIDYNDPATVEKLTNALEVIINRTLRVTRSYAGKDERIYRRALGWLGLKFIILPTGMVKIVDASKLIESLKNYQTDGAKLYKKKTGK